MERTTKRCPGAFSIFRLIPLQLLSAWCCRLHAESTENLHELEFDGTCSASELSKGPRRCKKKRENEAQEGTNCPGLLGETVGCLDYHGLREGAQVRCVRAEKPGGEGDQWWQPLGPLDVFTWHLSPPQLRTASQCFALLRPAPSAGAEGLVLATLVAHFST